MRLSRTTWLILGISVFVIGVAILFMVYAKQSSEQKGLMESLASAGTQLTKLVSGREALASQLSEQQSKLSEAQSSLNNAQSSFPQFPTGIEYDEVLTEIAYYNDLEVMSMTAEEPHQQKVEEITYIVLSFEIGVRGDLYNIIDMINEIAKDKRLVSATVEVVQITVPEVPDTGEEPLPPTATIRLVGYSYGGE